MTETRREAYLALGRYVSRTLSEEALAAYDGAMQGIEDEEVVKACIRWMRSYGPSTPLPAPKELRGGAHEPKRDDPKADQRPLSEVIRGAARGDYQHALARLMIATSTASDAERARLYRAFAQRWNESDWLRHAEIAEAPAGERERMLAYDRSVTLPKVRAA